MTNEPLASLVLTPNLALQQVCSGSPPVRLIHTSAAAQ
jgi:hypothetical protein